MQKGQKKGDKLSAPLPLGSLSNRKSQSLLQVLLTVKVLRHALLLQKILADYVLGATPSPYFNLCSYKKKTFELIASESHRKACQASYDRLNKIFRLNVINGPAEHVFKNGASHNQTVKLPVLPTSTQSPVSGFFSPQLDETEEDEMEDEINIWAADFDFEADEDEE